MSKHIEVTRMTGTPGDVVVVRFLDKKLTEPKLIQEAVGEITALVDEGHTKLVMAFAKVEMLTSPCMNALIRFKHHLDAKSGAFRICCLRPVVLDAFLIAKLDRVFVIKDTETDALADF